MQVSEAPRSQLEFPQHLQAIDVDVFSEFRPSPFNFTSSQTIESTLPIATSDAPPHLTLLGLPRELRDLIFTHVFSDNGQSYVKQQLLGFPKQDFSTYSHNFRALLTCHQIYAEASPLAYRLSCFYWFKSFSTATLERLCLRLKSAHTLNVRHIAFWSNPYLNEDLLDGLPISLNLTRVSVCSNYMSGTIPTSTIHGRVQWIISNVSKLKTLKSFHFLTGCGIGPGSKTTDCDFAVNLRAAFTSRPSIDQITVDPFDKATLVANIWIPAEEEGGRARKVELKVASVFESGFE